MSPIERSLSPTRGRLVVDAQRLVVDRLEPARSCSTGPMLCQTKSWVTSSSTSVPKRHRTPIVPIQATCDENHHGVEEHDDRASQAERSQPGSTARCPERGMKRTAAAPAGPRARVPDPRRAGGIAIDSMPVLRRNVYP